MLSTQPQSGPLQIDWSNPITRGLAAVFDMTGSAPIDILAGYRSALTTAYTKTVGTRGKGLKRASTGVDGSKTILGANANSAVVISSPPSAAATKPFFSQRASGGGAQYTFAANMDVGFAASTGTVTMATNGTVQLVALGAVVGGAAIYGYSLTSSTAGQIYVNGAPVSTTASGSGFPSISSPDFNVMYHAGAGVINDTDTPLILLWNRALSAEEHASLAANPWQIFFDEEEETEALFPVSGGSVTGTSATVNAQDAGASIGTTTVTGSLTRANANDTAFASGSVGSAVTGTSATTNANDVAAANGTTTVTGTVARTNANDAASASGSTTVTGSFARTNANDVTTASGLVGSVTGAAAVTNSNDACVASGSGSPNTQSSGGFFEVPQVPRRRSVKEERERLGIIPRQVKQIVQAVARASVIADKTDDQAEKLLAKRLAQQEIEAQARYVQFMQQERDRILARDVELALRMRAKRARDEEDEREAEMLLM